MRTQRALWRACLIVATVLSTARTGSAHRLDEYLQATRISVGFDRVGVEIDLTPGVAVANSVFNMIDTDHDRKISAVEAATYAHDVVGALGLSVDGHPATPVLEQYQFPTLDEMRRGEGTIRLRATSAPQPVAPGPHRVRFTNAHRPDIGVYLVNALASSDDRIRITNQSRDPFQREFSMDYTISASRQAENLRSAVLLLFMTGAFYAISRRFLGF